MSILFQVRLVDLFHRRQELKTPSPSRSYPYLRLSCHRHRTRRHGREKHDVVRVYRVRQYQRLELQRHLMAYWSLERGLSFPWVGASHKAYTIKVGILS